MHVNEKIGATEGCESSVLWCVKHLYNVDREAKTEREKI